MKTLKNCVKNTTQIQAKYLGQQEYPQLRLHLGKRVCIRQKTDKLQKIADHFGVSLGYLTGTEEEEPNATDKENNPIVLDDDALELLEELKERPEMRTLFSVSRKATKEDILKAVKIIEALKGDD